MIHQMNLWDDSFQAMKAVVLINEETQMNSLDLLYVSNQYQNLGIGYKLFKAIEDKFPSTKMWVTHTHITIREISIFM